MNKLYFGMYEKSELQFYAELNEDFECKSQFRILLFRFRSGTHGLNE